MRGWYVAIAIVAAFVIGGIAAMTGGIGADGDYHEGWEEGYHKGFYDGYDYGYDDAINATLQLIDESTTNTTEVRQCNQ